MRPDVVMFKLTDEASLSVSVTGQVTLLLRDQWHDITCTNLGCLLLDKQADRDRAPKRAAPRCARNQWPETSGTIQ